MYLSDICSLNLRGIVYLTRPWDVSKELYYSKGSSKTCVTIREARRKLTLLIREHREELSPPIQNPFLICTPATYIINYTFCESVWVNGDRVHPHWLILPAKFTFSSLLTSFPRDIFVPTNNTLGMALKRQECDGILMVLINFYEFGCLWKL